MNERLSRLWKSFLGLPNWVKVWVMILAGVNMTSLWFLDNEIGIWSAIAFGIVCALNMPTMVIQGGLTRVMSMPHIVWIPLLVFLYPRLFGENAINDGSSLYIFGVSIFIVNGISLMFDVYETVRWIRGGREILGIEN